MKAVSFIILMLCLLQPLACFAQPCSSCLRASDTVDISDEAGDHSAQHDSDDCASTLCCAEYILQNIINAVSYAPVISRTVAFEQLQRLPRIVIPIFIPPQNLIS